MSNKKLHLALVMTDKYFPLYEKMLSRTIPKDFDSINILHINDCENATPGLVGTADFKKINYKKLHFIYKQLKSNLGDNLLVIDADCVFFGSVKDEINELLETSDMVFQKNTYGDKSSVELNKFSFDFQQFCVATWALKCNEKNIIFFENEILTRSEGLFINFPTFDQFDLDPDEGRVNVGIGVDDEVYYVYKKSNHMSKEANRLDLWGIGIDENNFVWVHRKMLQHNPETFEIKPFDGDACVVNRALIEEDHDIKVGLLPDTYTVDKNGGLSPEKCKLYQSGGAGHGVEAKAKDLFHVYSKIIEKILESGNRNLVKVER